MTETGKTAGEGNRQSTAGEGTGKLWGGRFTKGTAPVVDAFHSSLGFDWRLYKEDIRASQVHARMLAQCGIISQAEAGAICAGLAGIAADIEAGKVQPAGAEDIHTFVERLLTERIGEAAKKLHTARSRNDQVATDTRLWVMNAIDELDRRLRSFQRTLVHLAEAHKDVVMPGYTHLQRAQPILLAHHLLAYFEMFQRDRERLSDCRKRTAVSPLGAGALAGVTQPIDRWVTARELGFLGVAANSIDAVSDRDFIIELLAALSLVMMHLSRLCEEVILWCSAEFGFMELDDAYSTGSSIMPQKKNPDIAELARGKTGRVYGHLMGLLTVMKGLPLAYNKDMQEDKEALFDAVDTVLGCLEAVEPMLATARMRADRMLEATKDGFLNATDLADYLAKKGLPFRDAHAVVGQAVLYAIEHGKRLEELPLEVLKGFSPLIEEDVYQALDVRQCVAARKSLGGTAPEEVEKGLARAKALLGDSA
ncbi:MAG: argininosuccinate lyase [Bacillota bacterium]|nr:MAG: argininosuccinate lyase [Bacillota bacterium]